ncbi:hypothetical protein WA026_012345 [Henosepilachna vigintioctopunctata]|uniref:Uncharacterized protein n=1 Tax=Henosepilachna vigintioctopunctata TaxID=420089 RepID=A0AAW1V009_9CUCU
METKGKIICFADHTVLPYSNNSWHMLESEELKELVKIKTWLSYHKLSSNKHKTKYMPLSSYSNNIPDMGHLNIHDGSQTPAAKSVNYLGILLNENMKWD